MLNTLDKQRSRSVLVYTGKFCNNVRFVVLRSLRGRTASDHLVELSLVQHEALLERLQISLAFVLKGVHNILRLGLLDILHLCIPSLPEG